MEWIKKNNDQFILIIAALGLIGSGVFIFQNLNSFGDQFAEAMAAPSQNSQIQDVDTTRITAAKEEFEKPTLWTPRQKDGKPVHSGLLFTSELYYVNKQGQLEKPGDGSLYNDSLTGKPIENQWFLTNNLPLLDPAVVTQDPDQDGFLNEDEWRAKTDPTNKESHPAYHTKLYFHAIYSEPFRFKYLAEDGDPKNPESFQINPLDAGGRTTFVKMGETIPGTNFKVAKYEFKERLNERTQSQENISELTVENLETKDLVVLVRGQVVNSANKFADLDYYWNKTPQEAAQRFRVPRLKEFALQPKSDVRYKLLDVSDSGAVIQTPDGEKVQVSLFPKK